MGVYLWALVVACAAWLPTQADGDHHPNILFIISDDLRVQLGYNKDAPQPPYSVSPRMVTPNLDNLASRSLVCHRAYAQQAVCNPSRSSLLTSRRPDTTRVYDSGEYFRESGGNFTTIPQFFRENGYISLGLGKIFHPGIVDSPSWSEPVYEAPNMEFWKSRKHGSNKDVSASEQSKMPLPDNQLAEKAIESLRRVAGDALKGTKPFFLGLGFHKPHLPFVFPTEMLDHYPMLSINTPTNDYAPVDMPAIAWHPAHGMFRYKDIKELDASTDYNTSRPLPEGKVRELRRAYYASVTYIDTLVGDVLQELKELGLDNNTIVSFFGDHGWHLGEHGAWSKQTNFELNTRVPFLLHIPSVTDVQQGMSSDNLVEMVDLFPTLVEATGFPSLQTCPADSASTSLCTEGRSLMPLIQNQDSPWMDAAFSQFPRSHNTMGYTMKTERYRYTEWVKKVGDEIDWDDLQGRELYDHLTDPEENINRLNDEAYTETLEELQDKLHKGWRAVD